MAEFADWARFRTVSRKVVLPQSARDVYEDSNHQSSVTDSNRPYLRTSARRTSRFRAVDV